MDLKSELQNAKMLYRVGGWSMISDRLQERVMTYAAPVQAMRAERMANDAAYDAWFRANEPDESERARQHSTPFRHRLSFIVPTWNTDPVMLKALIDSMLAQTTDAWEACFYDGSSTRPETQKVLRRAASRDPRIHVVFGSTNDGISGNTNHALDMVTTDWVALVDHDDLLAPDAAWCLLRAAEDGADFVYSDEDKTDETGARYFDPHLKGGFGADTLRAGNYICHINAMPTGLMRSVGGLRSVCDGSQDHDLMLRVTEQAHRIVHIPRVLYHWRQVGSSASHQGAQSCADASTRAVADQLQRLHLQGDVRTELLRPRIFPGDALKPDVSLIVACTDPSWLGRYLRRLKRKLSHGIRQTLVVGPGGFASVDEAVAQAKAPFIALMTQGVLPDNRSWAAEMQLLASREDIACAGALLMAPMRSILFGGYALTPDGVMNMHHGVNTALPVYKLLERQNRQVTAVSRHLLMIEKKKLLQLGGFGDDTTDLAAIRLGLKAQALGMTNVFVHQGSAHWISRQLPPFYTGRVDGEERWLSPMFRADKPALLVDLDRRMPVWQEDGTWA